MKSAFDVLYCHKCCNFVWKILIPRRIQRDIINVHKPWCKVASWVHYTTNCNSQSSAPEDGQNNCPKHVELTGIINKPLLLHLVCCLYYLHQWCTVKKISDNEIYLFIKYIKSVLWRLVKRLSYTEDARCLKVKQTWVFLAEFRKILKYQVSWKSVG